MIIGHSRRCTRSTPQSTPYADTLDLPPRRSLPAPLPALPPALLPAPVAAKVKRLLRSNSQLLQAATDAVAASDAKERYDAAALEAAALADARIAELLAGRTVRKVIAVPGRLVNVVAN